MLDQEFQNGFNHSSINRKGNSNNKKKTNSKIVKRCD